METRPVLGMPGMRPSFLVDVSCATHGGRGQTRHTANWRSLDSVSRSKELVAMFTDEHFFVVERLADDPDDYDEDEDDEEEDDDEDEEDDDEDAGEKWYLRPPQPGVVTQTPHTA